MPKSIKNTLMKLLIDPAINLPSNDKFATVRGGGQFRTQFVLVKRDAKYLLDALKDEFLTRSSRKAAMKTLCDISTPGNTPLFPESSIIRFSRGAANALSAYAHTLGLNVGFK